MRDWEILDFMIDSESGRHHWWWVTTVEAENAKEAFEKAEQDIVDYVKVANPDIDTIEQVMAIFPHSFWAFSECHGLRQTLRPNETIIDPTLSEYIKDREYRRNL